jgi:hypothetical protein
MYVLWYAMYPTLLYIVCVAPPPPQKPGTSGIGVPGLTTGCHWLVAYGPS